MMSTGEPADRDPVAASQKEAPAPSSRPSTVNGSWTQRTSPVGILPILLLALIAFAVYARTLSFGLVWDDHPLLAGVTRSVETEGAVSLALKPFVVSPGASYGGYYRPLSLLSLWADLLLQPLLQASFHLTNILIHAACSVLVYLLLLEIVTSATAAWLAALLFAVHPAHVESVAFVSGRTDTIAALFVLVSTLLWLRARESPGRGGYVLPALGAAAFLLACLSKETAYVLPAALGIWSLAAARWSGDDSRFGLAAYWKDNRRWILYWGSALVAAVVLRFTVLGASWGINWSYAAPRVPEPGAGALAAFAGGALQYLRLSILPWPSKVFYPDADLRLTMTLAAGAVPFVLLLLTAARADRKWRWITALSWFVLFLLPVSGLIPRGGTVIAERFIYIPSIGVSMLVAIWLDKVNTLAPVGRALRAVILIMAIAFAATTFIVSENWRDDVSVFAAISRDAPEHPMGPYNLGVLFHNAGALDASIDHFREALKRDPGQATAGYNLAVALEEAGRAAEAEEVYRGLVERRPDDVDAAVRLASLVVEQGRYRDGLPWLEKAGKLEPDNPKVLFGMTIINLGLGERAKAAGYYRRLVRLDPDNASLYQQDLKTRFGAGTAPDLLQGR